MATEIPNAEAQKPRPPIYTWAAKGLQNVTAKRDCKRDDNVSYKRNYITPK